MAEPADFPSGTQNVSVVRGKRIQGIKERRLVANLASTKLLLIEPDATACRQARQALLSHFTAGEVQTAGNVAQVQTLLEQPFDLVLTEMTLPDGTAMDLLDLLLSHRPDLPVVVVAAQSNLATVLQTLDHGAYDYVLKTGEYIQTIAAVVEKNLSLWRTKQENLRLQLQMTHMLDEVKLKNHQLEEMVRQLETMAASDPLTSLANRRSFNQTFEQTFAVSRRYAQDLTCIMIDLDGFKPFNDTYGHLRGDQALQCLAQVLRTNCRRSDLAGRYGGDEFVLLLPQTDVATARLVAKRIMDEFATAALGLIDPTGASATHRPVHLTLSMGMADLRHSRAEDPDQLLACADHALYRAKQAGRNRLSVYSPPPSSPPSSPPSFPPPCPSSLSAAASSATSGSVISAASVSSPASQG